MNTSPEDTSKDRITCPLCQAPLGSGSGDSLVRHLSDYHGDDDEQTPEPPLAMDIGLDEMAFVNVTLDENPASPPAASPSAAPPSAASPSAASPSAAGMDDESNTSDVDLDVSQRFGEADVRASTSAASAAAAAAVTSYLEEEIEVSRFTALEPC